MPSHFIRALTSKHRTKRSNLQLGMLLAFIAGAINAGGFLAVGYYTSHMTGIVSSIADFIALNQLKTAAVTFLFLLSFLTGAITTSVIINYARTKNLSSEFALALMLEALLLLAFGCSASYWPDMRHLFAAAIIALLCFIMGLQNAIITKISHAEIRTTHVTGLVTDIGIELGRYLYYAGSHHDPSILHPEKLKLHSLLLTSFITGGLLGAFCFKHAAFLTAIPLSLLLALLSAAPLWEDMRGSKPKAREVPH